MSGLEFVPAAKNGTEQKLCECGCGEPTPLAKKTNTAAGLVIGQPVRFLPGHNMRVKNKGVANVANSKEKDSDKPASKQEMTAGLDEVLGDFLDDAKKKELVEMLWEACKVRRKIRVTGSCPKCDCQHIRYAEDYDFNRSMKAWDLYMTRVGGRPATASGEDAGVIVKLVYVGVDE